MISRSCQEAHEMCIPLLIVLSGLVQCLKPSNDGAPTTVGASTYPTVDTRITPSVSRIVSLGEVVP